MPDAVLISQMIFQVLSTLIIWIGAGIGALILALFLLIRFYEMTESSTEV